MSFATEYDLIRHEMEVVWENNSKYINRLEKRVVKAENERDELKLEIKDLAAKVSDLSNALYEKKQEVEKLSKKLKQTPSSGSTSSKEFNALNIQLNKFRKENEILQTRLDELKYNKRSAFAIKQEPDGKQNILSMLQNIPKPEPQIYGEPVLVQVKEEDKENAIIGNSQTSEKFESTQSNEDQTINEEDVSYEEESLQDSRDQHHATFDIRHSKPIIKESIQLKSRNFELPSSSPSYHSTHEYKEEEYEYTSSSPIKSKFEIKNVEVKKELNSSQVYIVEDSQGQEDNYLYRGSIPTPQTTGKKFQTPRLPQNDKKRSNHLQTPIESETPLKKKKSKVSHKASSELKIDFTHHPEENRNWAIEDFKVNPAKNQNVTYAYHIVLRGKGRSCIHGKACADCEKFYAMAGSIPDFERLGPQWNDEPSHKKFDIVSETSRHRDLWERPESPPGFGDFDFPTTQEQKELNKKSDLMIRRTAYERLFSTLNDKKYIFREERLNRLVDSGNFKINENIFLEYLKKE